MSNKNQELSNLPTGLSENDIKIYDLEQQISQFHTIVEQQKQYNKNLREKMVLQEQLNNQLSNFHLTSYFQDRENKTLSTKK